MKFMIAVPSHSERITTVTASTLIDLQHAILSRGWTCFIRFYAGSPLYGLRNAMAGDCLTNGSDVLLMIDDDQGIPADAVLRMVDSGKPVVGVFGPMRHFDWSRVKPEESAADTGRILQQAMRYVGVLQTAGESSATFQIEDGLARARIIGGGIMLFRREVFERMRVRFPELQGLGSPFLNPESKENWGFFNPGESVETGKHVSEDYAFCERWRIGCGGEIWADVVTPITHVGRYAFEGSYIEHLKATHAVKVAQS